MKTYSIIRKAFATIAFFCLMSAPVCGNAYGAPVSKRSVATKTTGKKNNQGKTMKNTFAVPDFAYPETVMKNARILHTDPANDEARAEVMWAGSLSHNGLTGCGIASGDFMSHKMEHEMGGMFDVTHGAGLAALWPSWARYVYKDCLPRFVRFARNVMGVTADGTDEEVALLGIDAMVDFYHSIGMPASFHELGIAPTDAQINEMARRCLEASGTALGSAKKLSLDDIIAIYHAANT